MQADHHDLHALLQLVLELYYKDERYFTPTISWSNEHKLAAFGEYQFHENHIYISRLLNTDQISKEAIMSVIYHELLHQDGTEHGQAFDRMTEQFPNYGTLSQELEEYFGTIDVVPPLNPSRAIRALIDNTVLVLLPNEHEQQYLEQFIYCNRALYLQHYKGRTLPDMDDAFVVWLCQTETDTFVVGWSDDANLYSHTGEFTHEKWGGLSFNYQAKSKPEHTHLLFPANCTCPIPNNWLPAKLDQKGYCLASDIRDFDIEDVFDYLRHYSEDVFIPGLLDKAIDSCAPLTEGDARKLIAASIEETSSYRSLWIANLAVQAKPSYKTLFNQADALRFASLFDKSLDVFMAASRLKSHANEPKIEALKICIMLGNKALGRRLLDEIPERNLVTTLGDTLVKEAHLLLS